jgi:hypothetical protein
MSKHANLFLFNSLATYLIIDVIYLNPAISNNDEPIIYMSFSASYLCCEHIQTFMVNMYESFSNKMIGL